MSIKLCCLIGSSPLSQVGDHDPEAPWQGWGAHAKAPCGSHANGGISTVMLVCCGYWWIDVCFLLVLFDGALWWFSLIGCFRQNMFAVCIRIMYMNLGLQSPGQWWNGLLINGSMDLVFGDCLLADMSWKHWCSKQPLVPELTLHHIENHHGSKGKSFHKMVPSIPWQTINLSGLVSEADRLTGKFCSFHPCVTVL